MQHCLTLARRALAAGDIPVGALVVRDGHVIGEGYECTSARLDPTAHAEVEALRAACISLGTLDLSGATLYTTVEPCVLCAYAIRHARIQRVVFGANAGTLGGVTGPYPLLTSAMVIAGGSPPALEGGLLTGECERLLAERRAPGCS
jgi:tRNA(adenine34) deaminase